MKKVFTFLASIPLPCILTGCVGIGTKDASASIIYIAAAILSLVLLVSYYCLDRRRNKWFLLLFSSVLVVNIGYYLLSVAQTLEWALWCNRIAYLGSVFLPMSMLMIILSVTRIQHPKWLSSVLMAIGAVVLLIAGTPGYLTIYYEDVTLVIVDGVSSLSKVYGPLHFIYLVYLLGYFAVMAAVIIHAAIIKKLNSVAHAVVLLIAVFVNLGVWLIEQLVSINFEFLSVSYVISELFLLGLHMFLRETEKLKETLTAPVVKPVEIPAPEPAPTITAASALIIPENLSEQQDRFLFGLSRLTQTERAVYDAYICGRTTKEIMAELNIKENTLKFHNKNLYGKLGVSSRKQLMQIYGEIKASANSGNATIV